MITGLPPFYDTNVQRMYHKILHDPLKFPKAEKLVTVCIYIYIRFFLHFWIIHFISCTGSRQVSEPAKEFLRRILERKITDRLGSGPTGANELKYTQVFGVYDFNRIVQRGYEPEFKPPSSFNPADVRNFDPEFTNEKAADSMVDSKMSETMQEKANFEGFSYRPSDSRTMR